MISFPLCLYNLNIDIDVDHLFLISFLFGVHGLFVKLELTNAGCFVAVFVLIKTMK